MINPQWLEIPMFRTNFHGSKYVRAIEVRLYFVDITQLQLCLKEVLFVTLDHLKPTTVTMEPPMSVHTRAFFTAQSLTINLEHKSNMVTGKFVAKPCKPQTVFNIKLCYVEICSGEKQNLVPVLM